MPRQREPPGHQRHMRPVPEAPVQAVEDHRRPEGLASGREKRAYGRPSPESRASPVTVEGLFRGGSCHRGGPPAALIDHSSVFSLFSGPKTRISEAPARSGARGLRSAPLSHGHSLIEHRYCIASATCDSSISAFLSRTAMVRHLEEPVVGPGRQPELFHRLFEQVPARRLRWRSASLPSARPSARSRKTISP